MADSAEGLRPEALKAFWDWWLSVKSHVAAAIADRTLGQSPLVEYITTAVHNLSPDLAWELGPGRTSQHSLTVTAEGKLNVRRLAAQWLAAAPPRDATWEYFDNRRPSGGLELEIGGRKFAREGFAIGSVYDENRERFDVTVFHPEFRKVDDRLALQAAFLTFDGLLGEDDVERWIGAIDTAKAAPAGGLTIEQFSRAVEEARGKATGDRFVLGQGTSRDGKQVIISKNEALKQIDHLDHVYHVKIEMPPDDAVEDRIESALGDNAVHIGRATSGGRRELHLFVRDPSMARAVLQPLNATFTITFDPDWSAAKTGIYSMLAPRRG